MKNEIDIQSMLQDVKRFSIPFIKGMELDLLHEI